jgi:hypothetical protein|tara:strand:+ start:97 stop:699 length:603 start_codon:yes stop_codon:yes gene_type:complete
MNLTIEDIDAQVKDSPLSKEESRNQFVRLTKELGLKHSFNFDEVWEVGEEVRKRKLHREKLVEFEEKLKKTGATLSEEDRDKVNPLKHSFADGCYIREVFNPAGELLVTKIHKKKHPYFLMQGTMSILTDHGVKKISAPYNGITEPGTKRIIYTHTDCVFITVHVTDKTDLKEIESEVIAEDFNDPEITLHDIKLIKEEL